MNYRPIDIARKLNISTSTLRIYEDMGIIPPVKRSDSGYGKGKPDSGNREREIFQAIRHFEIPWNRYDRRGGKIPEKEPVCDAGKCGAPTEGRVFYRRSDRREGIG